MDELGCLVVKLHVVRDGMRHGYVIILRRHNIQLAEAKKKYERFWELNEQFKDRMEAEWVRDPILLGAPS